MARRNIDWNNPQTLSVFAETGVRVKERIHYIHKTDPFTILPNAQQRERIAQEREQREQESAERMFQNAERIGFCSECGAPTINLADFCNDHQMEQASRIPARPFMFEFLLSTMPADIAQAVAQEQIAQAS